MLRACSATANPCERAPPALIFFIILAFLIKTLRLQRLVSCLILVDDVVTCNIHTEWLNVISHSTVYLVASSSVLKIFTSSSIPQVWAPSFYIPIATTSFSLSLSLALIWTSITVMCIGGGALCGSMDDPRLRAGRSAIWRKDGSSGARRSHLVAE